MSRVLTDQVAINVKDEDFTFLWFGSLKRKIILQLFFSFSQSIFFSLYLNFF